MNDVISKDLNTLTENLSAFKDKIEGKTFLITGGAGFIGSWFSDVVISMGGRVICVDNISSGSMKNIDHLSGNQNFKLVKDDVLNYNPDEKIDYIVNMASIATPPLYMEHPVETLDTNIQGTRKLLELAVKEKVDGMLHMSTSEVYGNPHDEMVPTPEHHHGIVNSFGPRSMYDEGKRAAEAYCYSYYQKYKVPVRISRTFNTYGPRLDVESTSQYGRVLAKFMHQAINGNPITVYGDGSQTRSFCYITDQIEGLFRLLLTPGIDGEVFNIGDPNELTISDLAKMIVDVTNSKSAIEMNSDPSYNLKDDPRRRCPDIEKSKNTLGYYSKVELKDGLDRVSEWMRGSEAA